VSSAGSPKVLSRLLGCAWQHRPALLLSFGFMVVLGVTTGILAYLTGPALKFLLFGGARLELAAPWVPLRIDIARESALWLFPVAIVGIALLKGLSYAAQFYWIGLFGQRLGLDLRRQIFVHLSALSPSRLSRQLTGDLVSRFTVDVAAVEVAATYSLGSYVRDGLQILSLGAVAIWLNWRMALAALLVVPAAAFPISRLMRLLMRRTQEGQARLGQLAAQVKEGLGGLKTIQAFNAQEAEMARFNAEAQRHQAAMTRGGWTRAAMPSLMEVMGAIGVAGALTLTAVNTSVPPENLISLLTALVLIYQPAKDLGRAGHFGVQALASGERIFQLLDQPTNVDGAALAKLPSPGRLPAEDGERELGRSSGLGGSVRVQDVWFQYGDRPALAGLTLEVAGGKITALVGPSGAGKSTLISLLLRFDRPEKGRILLDGVDVQQLRLDDVRAQFALVTQEPLLFSASVLDNIRIGQPEATREEVVQAATIAQADAFIQRLPGAYDAPVGERGVVLSGGQKQKICLARAILSRAPILLLDEPTSNLDPESEVELQQALAGTLPGRTALIIAHRLSTIVAADRIYVMDAGRVVESGSHLELIRRGGLYARLWTLQTAPPEHRGEPAETSAR
jgi:subfamily B ATP-binding cassette protein MsbA